MEAQILRRGETGLATLEVVSGDVSLVTSALAKMRLTIAPNTEVAVIVTPRTDPTGWDLSLDPGVSSALQLGLWQLDVKLVAAGAVVITEPVGINVVLSASGI